MIKPGVVRHRRTHTPKFHATIRRAVGTATQATRLKCTPGSVTCGVVLMNGLCPFHQRRGGILEPSPSSCFGLPTLTGPLLDCPSRPVLSFLRRQKAANAVARRRFSFMATIP